VFQQYFQPDEAENQTAGLGGVTTALFPQFKTDGASRKGNKKGDDADLLFRILSAVLSFYIFSLYHS
jgi:hypothetical protein